MKKNKTNTKWYVIELNRRLKHYHDSAPYFSIKTSKYSKYYDYIPTPRLIESFIKSNITKSFTLYTQYNLNPFKINPFIFKKIKNLNNDFILYYIIFDDDICKKLEREKLINFYLNQTSLKLEMGIHAFAVQIYTTNTKFNMIDKHLAIIKIQESQRIKKKISKLMHR